MIVAPDLAAVELRARNGPGSGHGDGQERISDMAVKAYTVIGDVSGKSPMIVDDVISTAGTVVAGAHALR